MSETRTLLTKISALRQRLEQGQEVAQESRSAANELLAGLGDGPADAVPFEATLRAAADRDAMLDLALRGVAGAPEATPQPRRLTARARRVLEQGRELLGRLRGLADLFAVPGVPMATLGALYRDTVAMIDTSLRTVAMMPDSPTAQMQLCRGLEVNLDEVAGRLRTLMAGGRRHAREREQIDRLAAILVDIDAGRAVDPTPLRLLADEILEEARECRPLRFFAGDPADVPRFVACHGLTVARILARVARLDPEMKQRPNEAVLVGLIHDVGMLGVPSPILQSPEPIEGESRRFIEGHPVAGARMVAAVFPDAPWIAEAVCTHHERLDGTGYPDGLEGNRIRPLARLLAVCDVYAALCCIRPHRAARATRTALADTLMLAEQGKLDRTPAECLLALSFYPVGSVVELASGAIAVVVATPPSPADARGPSRPVVALLTDAQGEPLPSPEHLDLAQAEHHSIVRLLTPEERHRVLGRHFPRWAA
jgi:hypothetical protein